MTSTSKSSASFLPKVIFWLIVVIIGFGYIRSLAKHPGTETEATKQVQSASVATDLAAAPDQVEPNSNDAQPTAETGADSKSESTPHEIVIDVEEGVVVPAVIAEVTTAPPVEESQIESAVVVEIEAEPVAEQPVSEPAPSAAAPATAAGPSEAGAPVASQEPAVAESEKAATVAEVKEPEKAPETAAAEEATASPEPAPAAVESTAVEPEPVTEAAKPSEAEVQDQADEVVESKPEAAPAPAAKPYSQRRSESATKILKEFDEMRKAAEQERKAMYEMMRKQQETRDTMMPGSAYPRWSAPNYPNYNPYSQGYYPYGYTR